MRPSGGPDSGDLSEVVERLRSILVMVEARAPIEGSQWARFDMATSALYTALVTLNDLDREARAIQRFG